jgi:hypothetical protein
MGNIDEAQQSCMPSLYSFAWHYVVIHAAIYATLMAITCCWLLAVVDMESPLQMFAPPPQPHQRQQRPPLRPRPRYA